LRPPKTPPSTFQMAPVTQLVAGQSRKVIVLARSHARLKQRRRSDRTSRPRSAYVGVLPLIGIGGAIGGLGKS
jgi:hypothetical protein